MKKYDLFDTLNSQNLNDFIADFNKDLQQYATYKQFSVQTKLTDTTTIKFIITYKGKPAHTVYTSGSIYSVKCRLDDVIDGMRSMQLLLAP